MTAPNGDRSEVGGTQERSPGSAEDVRAARTRADRRRARHRLTRLAPTDLVALFGRYGQIVVDCY